MDIVPIGLSRVKAAAYMGLGTSLFDELVKAGVIPSPKKFGGRVIWSRLELEEALAGAAPMYEVAKVLSDKERIAAERATIKWKRPPIEGSP